MQGFLTRNLFQSEIHIRNLLLISGGMTCSMLLLTFAPGVFFPLFFGLEIDSVLMEFLVRSWSFLVFLVGGGLVVAAFHLGPRPYACLVAGISKLFFVALILSYSSRLLEGFLLTLFVDSLLGVMLLNLAFESLKSKNNHLQQH